MTHDEARVFIKRHLMYNAHKPCTLTDRKIKYWWRILNAAVFYNRLKYPQTITLSRLKQAYAMVRPSTNGDRQIFQLLMQPTFSSKELFLAVLVHEMVHAWEHQHYTVMGHGKRFLLWTNRIKRTTGLILEVKLGEEDYIYE